MDFGFIFLFFLLSLFLCYYCYMTIDPIKSCLYLVLRLITLTPSLSLMNESWYRYFVCIIFLSGIFVILVYFTRISKYTFFYLSLGVLIFLGLFFIPILTFSHKLTIYGIYYTVYFYVYFFLLLNLIYFINFSSYFLNFSGALRKA